MESEIVNKKLEKIENDLSNLKSMIIKIMQQPKQKQNIHLKGLLKGINISEKEIEESKKSLFRIGA